MATIILILSHYKIIVVTLVSSKRDIIIIGQGQVWCMLANSISYNNYRLWGLQVGWGTKGDLKVTGEYMYLLTTTRNSIIYKFWLFENLY